MASICLGLDELTLRRSRSLNSMLIGDKYPFILHGPYEHAMNIDDLVTQGTRASAAMVLT